MNSTASRRTAILLSYSALAVFAPGVAQQINQTPAAGGMAEITVNVNVVQVPVVVRDAQGRPVGNLKKEDFEIFDQGKPQVISGFTIQKHSPNDSVTKEGGPLSSDPALSVPDGAGSHLAPQGAGSPRRYIVFLFDDLHLSGADLQQVQGAATRMLAQSLDGADVADVVSFSGISSGMTQDRAKLQEAIAKLKPRGLNGEAGRQCPNIDYYQADLINKQDELATQSAIEDAMTCAHMTMQPGVGRERAAELLVQSAATQALAIGDQDARATLGFLEELAGKMASLPGERMIILVSPGFPSSSLAGMTLKSQIIDIAARSGVTINALDARGLYSTELAASSRGSGASATGSASQYHRDSMVANSDVMAELADGTGGVYFHNINDLQGGFRRLAAAPEFLYLLDFSPKSFKPNGTYHQLKVVVHQHGLTVQARLRYLAPSRSNVSGTGVPVPEGSGGSQVSTPPPPAPPARTERSGTNQGSTDEAVKSPAEVPEVRLTATVHGHVNDTAGAAFEGGSVGLVVTELGQLPGDAKAKYSFTVDDDGNFAGTRIEPGTYTVVFYFGDKLIDYMANVNLPGGHDTALNLDETRKEYLDRATSADPAEIKIKK